MRKIIYSVLITFASLSFFSCAGLLNDKYPEEAVPLSETAQAGYTADSRKPIISAITTGELLNRQTKSSIVLKPLVQQTTIIFPGKTAQEKSLFL